MVVVTGASAGVGRAVAREFAERGEHVALLARGAAGLWAALEEVEQSHGRRCLAIEVDVANSDAVEQAAEKVESELGPIDIWVNTAFSSVFAPFGEISAEEFTRTTEVTYLGFVHGTRAALTRMSERGRGTIVQVGSALAYRGIPLQSAYCGAKHAIQGFTESVRCELLHDKSPVHITMVQLPAVNTPQFDWVLAKLARRPMPVPPIYPPEVAAGAIVHAAYRPGRREYWVGMSTVLTLVANAIAPGLLDRYLGRNGYESQLAGDRRESQENKGNLWMPRDSSVDHGAHGRFESKTKIPRFDPQPWLSRHHGTVGAGLLAVSGAAAGVLRHRGERSTAASTD